MTRSRIDEILSSTSITIPADARVVSLFKDSTVLVTGAAGSVGSELCRQALLLPIRHLIAFDRDENGIFELLFDLQNDARVTCVIGDIRDAARVATLFAEQQPDITLHAAAYKHVSVMEQNESEAVLNNVTGTRIVAEAAIAAHCKRFVLISTDKAVDPCSVMGASKRAAEILLQSLASQTTSTRFCSVRFGNVIGSRGSVIPIFRRQIASGGPITLTDERMARYFISAADASQLVFQACCIADRGEVLALDMGEPLLIKNIAARMIQLSGKPVSIEVTGTRPGERLEEELWSEADVVRKTEFARILQISSTPADAHFAPDFIRCLRQLESAARQSENVTVRELLSRLIHTKAELHTGAHSAD